MPGTINDRSIITNEVRKMKTSFDNLTVRLYKSTKGKAIAYGSIVIDDSFTVYINLYATKNPNSKYPFIVTWPTVKNTKGEFADQAFPITAKARTEIFDRVLEEFKKLDI